MRRRWVSFIILLALASSISVGVYYLPDGNVSDSGVTNKSTLDEESGSQTGATLNHQSDKTQEDSDERRYVNTYEHGTPPEWEPVDDFSFDNHSAPAYEFTRYPDTDPTEKDLDNAWELYNKSFNRAKEQGYFDFEESVGIPTKDNISDVNIKELGDEKYIKGIGHHYVNFRYITTQGTLNPNKPEFLIYYQDPKDEDKMILAGYMYNRAFGSNKKGEQIAGPLTVWHSHDMDVAGYHRRIKSLVSKQEAFKTEREFFSEYNLSFNSSNDYYQKMNRTAEMMHVWFIEHPEGPFATRMEISEEYLREAEKMSEEEFKQYAMENYKKYFKEK